MAVCINSPANTASSLLGPQPKRARVARTPVKLASVLTADSFRRPLAWLPPEIDLTSEDGQKTLSEIDAVWPALSAEARSACLEEVRFTIPLAAPDATEILILPGGVLVMCAPEGYFVADPLSSVTFGPDEAGKLKKAISRSKSAMTLTHQDTGIVAMAGVPVQLATQSTTLLADAARLPKCAGLSGPALIQWGIAGVTLWLMGAAPSAIGLAARAAGRRLEDECTAVPEEHWAAEGSAGRRDLLAPGVTEMLGDLFGGEISDEFRYAVISRCLSQGGLAGQIAEVLGAIPASFQSDHTRLLGALPGSWPAAMAALHEAGPGYAILGLEQIPEPHRLLESGRKLLVDVNARMVFESGSEGLCPPVPVDGDAAMFLARRAGPQGRLGIVINSEGLGPSDLYAIANGLAGGSGAIVSVSAPAWGFCHRVTPYQVEAGNAAWFGMGAGLDELEILADMDSFSL